MSKLTKAKILELALNSSDPFIKETVDKLVFAIKLKYSGDELLHVFDNYTFHHSAVLHFPNGKEISMAWRNEDFAIVSIEDRYYRGKAADMVNNEPIAHHYIFAETNYKV
jgi:hypothetical protein